MSTFAWLAGCIGAMGYVRDDPTASFVTLVSVLRGKSDSKGSNGPGDNVDGESFHMAVSELWQGMCFICVLKFGSALYKS
jgi:hypothetical protein